MDLACKHGYLECTRCVDQADERARKVVEHYAAETRGGTNMYHDPYVPEGESFYKPPLTIRLKMSQYRAIRQQGAPWPQQLPDGALPIYNRDPEHPTLRCQCGSKLIATEALQTGRCHYCREGVTPPWTSRCECGSGLRGQQSITTGKCFDCRCGRYDDV